MAKLPWSEVNLETVIEDLLKETADPVASAELRARLSKPDTAKAVFAERIEKLSDQDWDKRYFVFQDESITREQDMETIVTFPLGAGDINYTVKAKCSYTRPYKTNP